MSTSKGDTPMTTKENLNEKRSSRVQVLEAIHSLYEQEMEITTASIVRHTGLKSVTVSDCLKELRDRDEIFNPERGVYRPCFKHEPSQAVTVTVMATGHVKLEKGDIVMELTPREWRVQLAPLAAGASAQTAVIEHTHQTVQLADQLRKVQRQVEGLKALLKANPDQLALLPT